MRLIDADLYVEMQLYDDEYEEWGEWNGTIEDLLNQWTERGCPPAIEVSEDCISREWIISFIDAGHLRNPNEKCFSENDVIEIVKKAPSVTPTERTGEWIEDEEQHQIEYTYHCSECGFGAWGEYEKTRYCGGCGAKMKGDTE